MFRCDGNSDVGVGHIMRMISLAKSISKKEFCMFVMADNKLKDLVENNGFNTCILETDYSDMNNEIVKMCRIIKKYNVKAVIVDSYYVTKLYFKELSKIVKLVYVDDLNITRYKVDIILNYNIYADRLGYEKRYSGTDTKLLLGPQYALLREEFSNLPKCLKTNMYMNVLISTGGADVENVMERILKKIQYHKYNNICFHVVLGSQNLKKDVIIKKYSARKDLCIHLNVANMAELMSKMDIAISAAGSTLYELCVCAIPTITYICADNQIMGARAFAEKNIIDNAGDVREGDEVIEKILQYMDRYIESAEERCKRADKMKREINPKGAMESAEKIISIIAEKEKKYV